MAARRPKARSISARASTRSARRRPRSRNTIARLRRCPAIPTPYADRARHRNCGLDWRARRSSSGRQRFNAIDPSARARDALAAARGGDTDLQRNLQCADPGRARRQSARSNCRASAISNCGSMSHARAGDRRRCDFAGPAEQPDRRDDIVRNGRPRSRPNAPASTRTAYSTRRSSIFLDDARSMAELVPRAPNVIVLRSMTKIFAIPGLRLGFAVACGAVDRRGCARCLNRGR